MRRRNKEKDGPKTLLGSSIHMTIPEAENSYNVLDGVKKEMYERGIHISESPELDKDSQFVKNDTPFIPPHISELANREIGDLYALTQRFYSYLLGQVAVVKGEHTIAKKLFKFIDAKVRLAKDGSVKDKDDKRVVDRRYVQADAEVTRLEVLKTILSAVVEGVDMDLKLISRTISLREQGMMVENRAAAIETRRDFSRRVNDIKDTKVVHRPGVKTEESKIEKPRGSRRLRRLRRNR
jgi:hypothetical protein